MSYTFSGTNQWLRGQLAKVGSYAMPVTLAIWLKDDAWPTAGAANYIAQIGNNPPTQASTDNYDSLYLYQRDDAGSGERLAAYTVNSTGGTTHSTLTTTLDNNVWYPFVGCFIKDGDGASVTIRSYGTAAGTAGVIAQNGTIVVADLLQYLSVGCSLSDGGDYSGKLAEFAVWDKELSAAEAQQFCAGTSADQIATANLVWYSALFGDTDKDFGTDSLASLTAEGASPDTNDHPPITYGGTSSPLILPHRSSGGFFNLSGNFRG